MYKGLHGIIVVFDVSNSISFHLVKSWLKERLAPENMDTIVVGNRIDRVDKRVIDGIRAKNFAESQGEVTSHLNN